MSEDMVDKVDGIIAEWSHVRPDLDVSPMGVIGRLSRLSRIVDRQLQEVFTEHDLQAGEFDVLATLLRTGSGDRGLTAGELAESAMVTSGAITNRLDRLVSKNLITREVDPRNRRTIRVALTENGREKIGRALLDHVENEREMLAVISPEQQDVLAAILRELLLSHETDNR